MTAVGYASTTGDARKVTKAGDTMTGDLVLNDSSPDTNLSAASKGYVLALASGTVVTETTAGQASTAGVAATYSRGDHTHGTPASGGGTAIRTADTRVTAGDVALATSVPWAIVTSGATPLSCAITAAIGNRIIVGANFMRGGSGFFLDLAILTSGGSISRYLGSGTSTPLAEGNPAYYPQASSFPGAPAPMQITVASGEVNGDQVTLALVYRGSGTQTVYASATYPFYLLLTNLGAQP